MQMNRTDRAKQFAPFDALRGLREAHFGRIAVFHRGNVVARALLYLPAEWQVVTVVSGNIAAPVNFKNKRGAPIFRGQKNYIYSRAVLRGIISFNHNITLSECRYFNV